PDRGKELVGLGVAGQALVAASDLVLLRRLHAGEHPVQRRQGRLQAKPGRELDRGLVRDRGSELAQALFDPGAVPGLGRRHLADQIGSSRVALALSQDPVDSAGSNLARPSLAQALDGFCGLQPFASQPSIPPESIPGLVLLLIRYSSAPSRRPRSTSSFSA